MKKIIELTEETFGQEVLPAAGLVLVDFYAPWCGPCKMLAPMLDSLAVEWGDRVKFAKANVDETPDLAAQFGITGVPTLMLFRGGKPLGRMVGLASPRQLSAWLAEAAVDPVANVSP